MVYNSSMTYSVKQLSNLAGVSIRTLHYYDQISLLKPSSIKSNGYRCYDEKKLMILQQILFFRELEFPLEKIKEIVSSKGYDPLTSLTDQHQLLLLKKKRIEKLLKTITTTIESLKGGKHMKTDDAFSAFNDPSYQKYKDEVEKRWGNSEAYRQSIERVGKMSKTKLALVKAEGEEITESIAKLMKKKFSYDNSEVQKQVDRFYKHLHHFYDPNYPMFKGLGQMYVSDPRFTKVYEKKAKGLAQFMSDAMGLYADTHMKK
jgi:DNA-binding transcriptional MerR regulator